MALASFARSQMWLPDRGLDGRSCELGQAIKSAMIACAAVASAMLKPACGGRAPQAIKLCAMSICQIVVFATPLQPSLEKKGPDQHGRHHEHGSNHEEPGRVKG